MLKLLTAFLSLEMSPPNLVEGSTPISHLQNYENSSFIQQKSSLLGRAFRKRRCAVMRSGRNGFRCGETIRPALDKIGQQKRGQ
jgi:hypothetical protein